MLRYLLALTVAAVLLPASASAAPPRALAGSGDATWSGDPDQLGIRAEPQSSSGIVVFKESRTKRTLLMRISGKPSFPLADNTREIQVPIEVIDADHARGNCQTGSKGSIQMRKKTGKRMLRESDEIILSLPDCGLGELYTHGHAGTSLLLRMKVPKAGASPWTVEFSFDVTTPGARDVDPPKQPKLELSYYMAERRFKGPEGLFRFPTTREQIAPDSWKVRFRVSRCDDGKFHWTVDGSSFTTRDCDVNVSVSHLGPVQVSVSHNGQRAQRTFNLKDWLVLGIGDSLASGEGVPDVPIGPGHDEPIWQDRQCHRSSESHQALTANALELKDSHNAVTFVHLACSGAAFASGLFGPYEGIEPAAGPVLAGQLYRYGQISGGRKPDVVLIAIGVNHAHFGAVLKYCTVAFEGVRDNCRNSHVVFRNGAFEEDSSGPTLDDYVTQTLGELPDQYAQLDKALDSMGVKAKRVYVVLYPDPTRNRDGHSYCKNFLEAGPGGVASIDPEDTRWLALRYALPLNLQVSRAAKKYGWNLVNGHVRAFYEHGYCAGKDRWTVTWADSKKRQGNVEGTVHPNEKGHAKIAHYEAAAVIDDLFPR